MRPAERGIERMMREKLLYDDIRQCANKKRSTTELKE